MNNTVANLKQNYFNNIEVHPADYPSTLSLTDFSKMLNMYIEAMQYVYEIIYPTPAASTIKSWHKEFLDFRAKFN
jgi:hypothetical protein